MIPAKGIRPSRTRHRSARTARRELLRARWELPNYVDMVTIGIRSGLSPSGALTEAARDVVGPLAEPVGVLTDRLQRGERLSDALAHFGDQVGGDAVGFADTLGTACRYGLPIEPVLDRLAVDSREARRRAADEYARTLPVRLAFPLVICNLPGFVLCAIVPALLGALSTLGDLSPT